jgi:hypothetical protein
LRIEVYFQQLRSVIEVHPLVASFNVAYDRRSTYEGYVSGELHFVDGSVLYVREYVDVETGIERLMYVYQYLDAAGAFVFRYDNTGHHRKLKLPTYPHHKHDGGEENVVAAIETLNLGSVLEEIEQAIQLE